MFQRIIRITDRPVCIFIDDLDRCDSAFVIELLEGIQTSFRHPQVTYVVAADKAWIRSSFEQSYDGFSGHVGDPGQPLGYLFLEKVFQLSTPIPGMSDAVKETYWESLLVDPEDNEQTEAIERPSEREDQQPGLLTPEEIELEKTRMRALIDEQFPEGLTTSGANEFLKEHDNSFARAALVEGMNVSPKIEQETKHLLKDYYAQLSENPRVMKRLLNAYTLRRTINLLGDGDLSPKTIDQIMRWTILEQSYPALGDILTVRPDLITPLLDVLEGIEEDNDDETLSDKTDKVPEEIKPFAKMSILKTIIKDNKGQVVLDPDVIRALI